MKFSTEDSVKICNYIQGWMNPRELVWILETTKQLKPRTVIEVGSWKGKSLMAWALGMVHGPGPHSLWSVEPFIGNPEGLCWAEAQLTGWVEDCHRATCNLIQKLTGIEPILSRHISTKAALDFRDESADVVFIDGSHLEKDVRDDIDAWLPVVRKGGLLAGHDRDTEGVRKALAALLPKAQHGAGSIWWVKK